MVGGCICRFKNWLQGNCVPLGGEKNGIISEQLWLIDGY